MSQRALCLAVRDLLQDHFGWEPEQCDVSPLGRPHADSGEIFVGVHEGGYRNKARESLHEDHTFLVTISRRVTFSPEDRVSQEAIHALQMGLDVLVDEVKAFLHMDVNSDQVRNVANDYLLDAAIPGTVTVYGFSTSPAFRAATPTQNRGSDWFRAKPEEKGMAVAGLSVTLSFDGCERLQPIKLQQ